MSIDHSLAKELREAGLRQPNESFARGYFYYWDGVEAAPTGIQYAEPNRVITGTVWAPTLSELIEACGEEFRVLERDQESRDWMASTYRAELKAIHGLGDTPEEAVARLWLAINRK